MQTYNEEKMLPLLRACLARRLQTRGFRVYQISRTLGVTQPAVIQYLKGVRGKKTEELENQKQVIDALADKAAQRINDDKEPLGTIELLDVIHQILTVSSGEGMLHAGLVNNERNESIAVLKDRLQLELTAAQKCFSLANIAKGEYTRILLRMIASDSIRHADIVSQIISFLETGIEIPDEGLDRGLLTDILAIEDSADEISLRSMVKINHGVAKLLLESIDLDEKKHDRLLGKMKALGENERKTSARSKAADPQQRK